MKTNRDKERISPAMDLIWRMTCSKMTKRLASDDAGNLLKRMELVEIKEDTAVIQYDEGMDLTAFEENYGSLMEECLEWSVGHRVKTNYIEIKDMSEKPPKIIRIHPAPRGGGFGKKRLLLRTAGVILITLTAVLILTAAYTIFENRNFKETFYQAGSGKVNENLRIIQLSDLHNTEYGENNKRLVDRIVALKPDIIVMSGDMIEESDASMEVALNLCQQLVGVAPVYYIYGNHETSKIYGMDLNMDTLDELLGNTDENRDVSGLIREDDDLRTLLEAMGVQVLLNQYDTLEAGGVTVDIYGCLTSNPYAFWPYAGETYREFLDINTDHFKLMVSHEPYVYETYGEGFWGDLVLSGHTHGGLAQLPYFGGLYERKHGIFPEKQNEDAYIAGQYTLGDHPLIVNTGLSNRGMPRVNNQPELLIIDVNRY